ncbi:MAG TPA: hypothetical protein VMG12_40510 [Polyangiaceae bacterium]|nr:hypothetical protein [Polyangiaceae bacterium]
MKSALEFDARVGGPRRAPIAPLGDRYSIVGKLRSTGRAEVTIGLPAGARSIDELVVIKAYSSREKLVEAPPEVEVAATPRHDNLARILESHWDAERYVLASEYLEGTTLRRLLRWLAAREEKLPDAAVTRILLGMFAAVEHANQWTRASRGRALVHEPIDATDVFITYDGDVKVLGFKPQRAREAAAGRPTPVEPAAVDDLLSNQLSPTLAAVLARIGNRVSATSLIGLWQVAQMLKEWQRQELRSDGRAALVEVMASVQPAGRAARRSQLEVAVNRVVRARDEAEASADAAPVSGYRMAYPSDTGEPRETSAVVLRPRPAGEPDVPATVLVVRTPELVARRQQFEPPVASRTLSAPHAARRRSTPWASLVLLVGALAAGLVVFRHPGVSVDAPPAAMPSAAMPSATPPSTKMSSAHLSSASVPSPAPLAPTRAPTGAYARRLIPRADSDVAANEATPAAGTDRLPAARPKPAGAPARLPSALAPTASAAPQRRALRRDGLGSAVLARPAAPVSAPGFLTLDTTPWSTVSSGGVLLGQTPLVKVELPAGQHVLELANAELGITTSIFVEITSGNTTVRRVGLERPIAARR